MRAGLLSSAPPLDAGQRRFLTVEIIVNAVASGILSAAFVRLMFGGMALVPLWGADGLAFDLVPTTFMITLMMTLGLTLFTRWRCATGRAPRCDGRSRLPTRVWLRAPLLAAALTVLLVPAAVLLLWLAGPDIWTYGAVMVFKIVYGVALAAALTPVINLAAMRDAGSRP